MIDSKQLTDLQNIKYESIEKDKLKDVKEITLDTSASVYDRVEQFIEEVKNPYVLKCGNTIVEFTFSNQEKTIDHQITCYLKSLKQGE